MAGLTELPKVGEKVMYLGGDLDDVNDLTIGSIYEIVGADSEGIPYIYDDGGIQWHVDDECNDNLAYYELVTEPQPDVPALIANLGRRLHEVEEAQEDAKDRKFYDDMVAAYEDIPEDVPEDAVNPAHYKRGKYETIDIIEHITAGYSDPFVAYCVGSTVKYVDRAPFKHDSPAECLRKAAWYLTKAADHIEAGE